ncbi:MAG: 16S rRNA (guanine(966)-N(2))-methyltransferase RsmD [Rhodocyclaceae bacterium]|nr:16S rRNA (guanine(966)-N(2))-methyltransferase RsmD [Rhodocyclaceae bacterium]
MSKVRLTGGQWRSRQIVVLDAPGLRPTPDRVRETLFNWLGQDLSGLTCLDLFAGSGILGLEAASRGAAQVTFVEQDRHVFAQLQKNITILEERARIKTIRANALEFLASQNQPHYDLVFLDPPYRQNWLPRLWPLLGACMNPSARLYVEAEAPVVPPAPWQPCRSGRVGQVHTHLFDWQT